MLRAASIPIFAVLLVAAASCPDKRDEPSTERHTDAAEATESHPEDEASSPTDTPGSADSETADEEAAVSEYVVFDNGRRCITHPCFSWTTRTPDGETEDVSGVDLSPLGLSQDKEQGIRQALANGERYTVRGSIVTGKKGPAGVGKNLRVTAISEPPPSK